jgi:hypothetical protein
MRDSQRDFASGRVPLRLVVVLALVAGMVALVAVVVWRMRPEAVVARQQAALLDGVGRRSPARIRRLVAEDYADRWGFSREDLVEAMVDAGGQFIALVVTARDGRLVIEGRRATYVCGLVVGGKPVGPIGQEVMRQVNRIEEPFVFVWERKGFLPSGWRLVGFDNPAFPDDLHGYRPGDFRRAMQGE